MLHNGCVAISQSSIAKGSADTAWISQRARSLGFDLCGVVRAEKFAELWRTEEWLARGYAGEMRYLHNPGRADPRMAMPGLRSIIVCALNYNSPVQRSVEARKSDTGEPRGWISRYAWGRDYHDVVQGKLRALATSLRERFSEPFETRICCDAGPLNERVLGKHAGLGWLGKNTLLLNSKLGSWFFLGALLTTLELSPSLGVAELPPPDLCGSCTKCIDACPTDALVEPYVMDARRCISYLTIELRGNIPQDLREAMGKHVFGCDICQDVCPWNRRAPTNTAEEFQPRTFSPEGEEEESLFLPRLVWLASMSEEQFRSDFRDSAMKRAKWRGLVRNACIALGNAPPVPGSARWQQIETLLAQLSASVEPTIADSAEWALSCIDSV